MKLVKKHVIINLILGILHMSKCKVPITDIVFSYLNCISLSLPPEILLLLKCTSNVHLYPSIMTTYSTVVGLLYSTIYIFYFLNNSPLATASSLSFKLRSFTRGPGA